VLSLPTLRSTTCTMASPPELYPYLCSNYQLPQSLHPLLEAHLSQTRSSIAALDTEIALLEAVLFSKREERLKASKIFTKHSQILCSARKIPPEVWGIVFSFALGEDPFGRQERKAYCCIRAVCRSWRDVLAETPGIFKGLVVDLDGPLTRSWFNELEAGKQQVKEKLQMWLTIMGRNRPYHLDLGLEDEDNYVEFFEEFGPGISGFVQWILTNEPAVNILSVREVSIFTSILDHVPPNNQISQLTLAFNGHFIEPEYFEKRTLQEGFPCLQRLIIHPPFDFLLPMQCPNLQALTLTQVWMPAHNLLTFLSGLPSLRELMIASTCPVQAGSPIPPALSTPLMHPKLEILVIEGEDMMLLLEHVTFPVLKFLALMACGPRGHHEFLIETIPSFLRRCSQDCNTFMTSISGQIPKSMFDSIVYNLPPDTRLHLDARIDLPTHEDAAISPSPPTPAHARTFSEVFCTQNVDDLQWLRGNHEGSPANEQRIMYMLEGVLGKDEVHERKRNLRGFGYTLAILPVDAYRSLLRSSMPPMTVEWDE
jgi:hypothetical protein